MPEELGKIEKPAVEEFKSERKLYFIPLVIPGKDPPAEFTALLNKYWDQVEAQVTGLENKLGLVQKVYHELISKSGDEGISMLKEFSENSYKMARIRIERGARFESIEDEEILAELMDWNRCLSLGLQSQKAAAKIYEFYLESEKLRNGTLTQRLDESLKSGEAGLLFMAEGHPIQFPASIRVLYVSPPALDEMKRWRRDFEARKNAEAKTKNSSQPGTGPQH